MSDVDLPEVGHAQGEDRLIDLAGHKVSHSVLASDCLKCAMDLVLALTALLVLAPIMLMACLALLMIQGRPIFIAQRRVGRYGAIFPCLKFRTMVTNGEELLARYLATNPSERDEWQKNRKLKNDPRITAFGALLRKSSLDEIPQLINILAGHMSLVGPRPITTQEAELYGAHFADYTRVRPGLTGLWQISGRSDTGYGERVKLDVSYVASRSLWGDVVIMAKTVPAVLSARGSY